MKSLMLLWKEMAEELAIWCCTSATRDCKTVVGRTQHEGLSFLTITLPEFGKATQKWLDQGQVVPSDLPAFHFGKGENRGLPAFLRGFLGRVFCPSTGVLLSDPDIDAIFAIRQLTLTFSKILLPCSEERVEDAMKGFVQCEHDVRSSDRCLSRHDRRDFRRVSSLLFAGALSEVDREVYLGELLPKHGPGATADSLRGNAKYRQSTWPARLEEIFPSGEYLIPNWRYNLQVEAVDVVEPGSEIPVKVIPVPKTLKTPRIIAVEPTAMQYAQQAVLGSIVNAIERDDFLSRVIGFTDQTPNQEMARKGSLSGDLATLDLSEASDRVSNQQVRDLLANHKWLFAAVDASRSRKADVPGHGVIRLAKFASMGSALCFPFEAMVFTTLIFLGIERELNTQLDRRTLYKFRDQVRVYGDDLIVPVEYVPSIVKVLETFGSRVGLSKSYWNGKFRESCGKEYYDGQDVSIVKVRRKFPARWTDCQEVVSLVSLRNQLYYVGMWQTVKWLDRKIKGILRYFPRVLPTSPVLGRHSFLGYDTERVDEHLHSPLVKGWKVSAVQPSDVLDDVPALLKCLLMMERRDRDIPASQRQVIEYFGGNIEERDHSTGMPTSGEDHLMRSGRPRAFDIKLGYASAT